MKSFDDIDDGVVFKEKNRKVHWTRLNGQVFRVVIIQHTFKLAEGSPFEENLFDEPGVVYRICGSLNGLTSHGKRIKRSGS